MTGCVIFSKASRDPVGTIPCHAIGSRWTCSEWEVLTHLKLFKCSVGWVGGVGWGGQVKSHLCWSNKTLPTSQMILEPWKRTLYQAYFFGFKWLKLASTKREFISLYNFKARHWVWFSSGFIQRLKWYYQALVFHSFSAWLGSPDGASTPWLLRHER